MSRAVASLAIAVLLVGCGKAPPSTRAPGIPPPRFNLSIPAPVDEVRIDFEEWKDADWSPSDGKWIVRKVEDAPSGTHVLERAVLDASSPAFVWGGDEFADVEVSATVRVLGGQPTEIGIVLRQTEGSYYVFRVDLGKGTTRLNGVEKGTIAQWGTSSGSSVRLPAGTWHTLTAIAIGDDLECRVDSLPRCVSRQSRFKKGKVGLWWMGGNAVQVDDFIVRTHASAISDFDGLDWNLVSVVTREKFFARANGEKCPCGSGRTLARCRKAGCYKALERGRDVLEQCEME